MATSDEIKQRALELSEKTDVNSITPKEVGGIMYDLASHGENVLRNGGTLGIRKVYESVAAMEADSTFPKDLWGEPLKKGNLVVIYDGTSTGVDNNKIYAFLKPGWQIATHLDAGYATKASLDAAIENILLRFKNSENALNESIGNLEETVTGNKQEVDKSNVFGKNPTECLFEGRIANGIWYAKDKKFIVIPVIAGARLSISVSKTTYYTFLRSFEANPIIGSIPDFSVGYTDRVLITDSISNLIAPNEDCFFYLTLLEDMDILELSVNGVDVKDTVRTNQQIHQKLLKADDSIREDIKSLSESCRKDFVLYDGWIDDSGTYNENYKAEGKVTNLIPIDNNGINVSGVTICGANVSLVLCYSELKISRSSFLGSVGTDAAFKEGTKAIVIRFRNSENPDGYDNLVLIKTDKLADRWASTPFVPKPNVAVYKEISSYDELFTKAIKGFYVSGNVDIESAYRMLVQYTGLNGTLRIVIYDSSEELVYSNYFTVSEDGYVCGEYTYSTGICVKIEAYMKGVEPFLYSGYNSSLFLSKKAFINFIDTESIKELQDKTEQVDKDVEQLLLEANNADYISVKKGTTIEEDWSYYFNDENGGSSGYVLSTTGAEGSNSVMRRTGFVLCINCEQIKTLTPDGSQAGTAFYDSSKKPIDYNGSGKAGFASDYRNKWVAVPKEAVYVRTTYNTSEQPVFMAKVYEKESLQSKLDSIDIIEPRVTNVLCGYEGFNGMNSARVSLSQPTYSESVKQIEMKTEQCINRTQLEAVVIPTSDDCHVGVGYAYSLRTEVRVKGNIFEIYYIASASDTYEAADGTIVFSDTLPFTVTSGKMYKIGIYKTDSEPNESGEYAYLNGARFYVEDVESGKKYEKYIQKSHTDGSQYNGIRSGAFTICIGKAFLTLKKGSCEVVNISLSSNYNPRAKVVLVGDSFVAGDTMITEGLENRYAALMQDKIGYNDMVLVGKGGEAISTSTTEAIKYCLRLFKPEYFILALGTNNYAFNNYKAEVESILEWCDIVGIKPVLVTITPRGDNYNFIDIANPYVRNSGRRYVDLNKAVTSDSEGHIWKDGYVKGDGTHPSVEGHRAMYEAFCRELPEIFM